MPVAIERQTAPPTLDQIHHTLSTSLQRQTDPSQSHQYLQQAKLALLKSNALIPSSSVSTKTLLTARSILEIGALLSIRAKDPPSFIRYWSQLQPFYDFPGEIQKSPSTTRSKITGLYLLLLLSQGDYQGFHTLLETLIVAESDGGRSVEEDKYIKYPIELEKNLMEGSYDQVWHKTKGREVPDVEFALFSDILINTIRLEIASCAVRSYPSLPIASAKNLLFLDSEGAVVEFAQNQGWSLEDGRIYFPLLDIDGKKNGEGDSGDQRETISNMVGYTRELEMIV